MFRARGHLVCLFSRRRGLRLWGFVVVLLFWAEAHCVEQAGFELTKVVQQQALALHMGRTEMRSVVPE